MGFRMYEALHNRWTVLSKSGHLVSCIFFLAAFVLAGIAVVVLSVILLLNSQEFLNNADKGTSLYLAAIYTLLVAGGLMAFMGFLGCYGALRESPCLLGTFFLLLVVLIATEITGCVLAYIYKDAFRNLISTQLKHMVQQDYSVSDSVTVVLDNMQKNFKCCGATGPQDWLTSAYTRPKGSNVVEQGISAATNALKVPPSCCATETGCDISKSIAIFSQVLGVIHSKGCADALWENLESHITLLIAVGVGIAVLQILGLIFTIVLCCAIRREGSGSFKA